MRAPATAYLHFGLIEDILNLGMQRRKHSGPSRGLLDVKHQRVIGVVIEQTNLEHPRFGFLADALGAIRRHFEHGMHLTPWGVVTDGHGSGHRGTVFLGQPRVIVGRIANQHRVGHGDELTPRSQPPFTPMGSANLRFPGPFLQKQIPSSHSSLATEAYLS